MIVNNIQLNKFVELTLIRCLFNKFSKIQEHFSRIICSSIIIIEIALMNDRIKLPLWILGSIYWDRIYWIIQKTLKSTHANIFAWVNVFSLVYVRFMHYSRKNNCASDCDSMIIVPAKSLFSYYLHSCFNSTNDRIKLPQITEKTEKL